MPPLRGVIVDPEYPPTAEEALQAIKNHELNYDAQWQGQQQQQQQQQQPPSSSSSEASSSQPVPNIDPFRGSGTSKIFGRVAGEAEKSAPPVVPFKKPEDMGVMDVLSSITLADFKNVYKQPCFRETFMYSMISGFLVAGSFWILGKRRRWIVNGGVSTAASVSFVEFHYCMWQRREEKKNMVLVKETWEETKAEKKAAWEAYKAKKKADELKEKSGKVEALKKPVASSVWNLFWSSGNRSPPGREG